MSTRRGERALAGTAGAPLEACSRENTQPPPRAGGRAGGFGCRVEQEGAADGTSLEKGTWKSIPAARVRHGNGSPDAGTSIPELVGTAPSCCQPPKNPRHGKARHSPACTRCSGRARESPGLARPPAACRRLRPMGGCQGPVTGAERGGCTAARSSSWVIFMLSEK